MFTWVIIKQSVSLNSTGFVNPNFITGNVPDHSLFDDDSSLVDDLSEDHQFIGVIQAIINKDEILRIIRGIVLPVHQKKARKARLSKVGRCTSETLQASI